MNKNLDLLKKLISLPGLSGFETPVHKIISEAWQPLVSEMHTSAIGSLHALKKGSGTAPRCAILIATHMDAIGLMVTRIQDGFLFFTEIGGIDPRVLPGQPVMVHGREDLPGMVVQPHKDLLAPEYQSSAVPLDGLMIDTGLPANQVMRLVRVGDVISFAQPPIDMGENILAGHSLDNRASVVALTICLDELQKRTHAWDVYAVATAQEEVTLGGAFTAAYDIRPDIAVAVDVSFASGPGDSDHKTFGLGKGPTLGWGPNIHPGIHKAFKSTADSIELKTQLEIMPSHSGTDTYAMQISADGIPTMVISIPLRYMHTPVEMISFTDVQRVGRLLAEFISNLTPDFMDQLSFDD